MYYILESVALSLTMYILPNHGASPNLEYHMIHCLVRTEIYLADVILSILIKAAAKVYSYRST